MQPSQSLMFTFNLIIFLPKSSFSSFIPITVSFDHGVNDSVCLRWHEATLSFLMSLSGTISFSLSHVMALGTAFHQKIFNSASCTSFDENEHDHPKLMANTYAHSLPLLKMVFSNNISLTCYAQVCCNANDDHLFETA